MPSDAPDILEVEEDKQGVLEIADHKVVSCGLRQLGKNPTVIARLNEEFVQLDTKARQLTLVPSAQVLMGHDE